VALLRFNLEGDGEECESFTESFSTPKGIRGFATSSIVEENFGFQGDSVSVPRRVFVALLLGGCSFDFRRGSGFQYPEGYSWLCYAGWPE